MACPHHWKWKNHPLKNLMNKNYAKIILFVLGGVFLFLPQTSQAITPFDAIGFITDPEGKISDGINLILQALANILVFVGGAIDIAINLQNYLINQEMVKIAWTIIRDFVNIFFILLLVIIAFATVLNIQKYSARSLLAKLIVAAILINFSLVIGNFIVNALYVPAVMFKNAIGEDAASLKIADSLQFNKISKSQKQSTGNIIITGIFGSIFLLIAIFAIGVGAVALLGRIPIIMLLLVVSPAVWLFSILPNTQNIYKQWWEKLLKWSIFPVIYLGFIYFALFFTSRTESAFSGISGADAAQAWGLTIQQTMTYILGIAFLIGAFWVANEFGGSGGKWIYSMGTTAWRGTGIPGRYTRTKTRIKEEGIPRLGYGGARALRRKEAKPSLLERAAGLPVLPRDIAKQREMLVDVNKEIDFIKDLPQDTLREIAKLTTPRGIAAKIRLAESEPIKASEFAENLKDFGPGSLIEKRYYDAA